VHCIEKGAAAQQVKTSLQKISVAEQVPRLTR
jgi:hypothetical protein